MPQRTAPVLEVLSADDCFGLLAGAAVGRVGLSIDALPVVLPVNFAVWKRSVVFRTVPGTKLDAALAGSVVAFEADAYEADGASGWSVLVQGRAEEVTEAAELAELKRAGLRSWALGERADRFVCIDASLVSGRRFLWPVTDLSPSEQREAL
jgi:uncharacterized protein